MNKFIIILFSILQLILLESCTTEDNPYSFVDTEYIKFVPKGRKSNCVTKDIHLIEGETGLFLFDHELYLQDMSLTFSFQTLSDCPLKLSIGKSRGYCNLNADRLEIYRYAGIDQQPELNKIIELPSNIIQGVTYQIGFNKTLNGVEFYLTGDNLNLRHFFDATEDFMQYVMPGKPFIAISSGDIRIFNAMISSTTQENPLIHIIGDSFIEGGALPQFGFNLNERWCITLASEIGSEKCMIDGIGGDYVGPEWFERLKIECGLLKSKYVLICMGTNNYYTIDTYREYMTKAITFLHDNNQIPILVTVTPRTGIEYHISAKVINEWVKNSGETYIDFHAALTEANNPSEWKPEYILPDGIHPSPDGYKAMYNRLKIDLPVLFTESAKLPGRGGCL